jgi:hypothetical protein
MSTAKIQAASRRYAFKFAAPIETLTPEQMRFRVQLAYVEGYERGRRDQRNHAKRSRGNKPEPIGSEEDL